MRNEFTAIIEPPNGEDEWFVAYCLEIPEANGQGRTQEEARENLAEGIDLVLEVHREECIRGASPGSADAVLQVLVVE